ncbi:membrane protein [Corynebacterium humireducens NBRC 106098 = DSM 45392]|uniref:Membrane protein n=1 Tax=Corynebacterium humireducens NBRC 106098 = DSM 45392 TaxID=1223515 RepID=A0A0B5D6P7_9CORY|nr:phage holin family protein [Corynebacterium humireducens]AJE32008.1 membrane protein [Corynebacterium humireducens NBRC 106098 = DSM 45392]
MIRLLLSIVTTAIALFLVTRVVPGVDVTPPDDPWAFIWVALLFMVVNAVVSPLAHALGTPLKILTLGLFSLVINALLFMFTGWLSGVLGLGLSVDGFVAGLLGAVVMGVATWALGLLTGAVTPRR